MFTRKVSFGLFLCLFSACTALPSNAAKTTLIGEWLNIDNQNIGMVVSENGTGEYRAAGLAAGFKWHLEDGGKVLVLTMDKDVQPKTSYNHFQFDGNTLTITSLAQGAVPMKYRRTKGLPTAAPKVELKIAPKTTKEPVQVAVDLTNHPVVGKWQGLENIFVTFNGNGTGEMRDKTIVNGEEKELIKFKWTIKKMKLRENFNEVGDVLIITPPFIRPLVGPNANTKKTLFEVDAVTLTIHSINGTFSRKWYGRITK